MAGLVPAIHVFLAAVQNQDMDARHEAGHDGGEAVHQGWSWPGLSRPSRSFLRQYRTKAWMPGTRPGMTPRMLASVRTSTHVSPIHFVKQQPSVITRIL